MGLDDFYQTYGRRVPFVCVRLYYEYGLPGIPCEIIDFS